jgi:hypothetical protein
MVTDPAFAGAVGAIDHGSMANVAPIFIFGTLALSFVSELVFMTWLRFKQRRGLYFYTLNVAALGVAMFAIGLILKFFELSSLETSVSFQAFGWALACGGQSMVLYSRLNLVVMEKKPLKWVLAMIVMHAILIDPPVFVSFYGVSFVSKTNLHEGH